MHPPRDIGGDDWIGRVDFLDPEKRLLVEVDSDLHHSGTPGTARRRW